MGERRRRIFNRDQAGTNHLVYPSGPQADTSLFVGKDQSYHAPGAFDLVTGVERFYAIASEQPFSFKRDIRPYFLRKSHARATPFSFATMQLQHR